MIRNKWLRPTFTYAFLIALVIHVVILIFVKKKTYDLESLSHSTRFLKEPLKLNQIEIMKPEDVEKFRKVGIKDGAKDANRPDIMPKQNPLANIPKPPPMKNLSLGNLKPQLDKLPEAPKSQAKTEPAPPAVKRDQPNLMGKTFLNDSRTKSDSPFYFNYKDQKVIPRSREQEDLKSEAVKNFSTGPINKATERISNFEIRYERPEGVSEDELNSDEKAYYSFYVRSYKNYFAKIYSNYERLVVERPGLARVFDNQHLLIGKIDYDEQGNIITVRILKSSESDDLHYFFEETLKQLSQPNPPKVFTKNRKQFSIYYQLQIN
jgi:hypothetical protein